MPFLEIDINSIILSSIYVSVWFYSIQNSSLCLVLFYLL